MTEVQLSNIVELGWAARPMKEQHPILSDTVAEAIDADNVAISRLRLRGMITDSELRKIRARFVKSIENEIIKAVRASNTQKGHNL